MVVRNCSGGIVFNGDNVLMLLNDKHEWVFPKGVISRGEKITDVAVDRVFAEAGIKASIVAPCGKTHYEFYSVSRQKPVHNNVSWFVMKSDDNTVTIGEDTDFIEGGFFPVEEALENITYSQDRSLLMMAYQRYKEMAV